VWTIRVIVEAPVFNRLARLRQGDEFALVETFVAKPAIKRFDLGVLGRLAGRDMMQPNAVIGCPT
jgi:hypothetical protein